jgi:beta-lactam-binding protein with PASTA domain
VQKTLEKFGLLLSSAPEKTKQVAESEAGKIIGQNPSAGVPLSPGKAVSVIVGVAAKQAQVPNVCDKPLGVAQKALQAAGLSVGPVQPSVKDLTAKTLPTNCQQPAAGQQAAGKSPVSLFLASPKGASGGGVPEVTNEPADTAAKKLQDQGLNTVIIPVLAPLGAAQVGTVVSQKPGQGAQLAKGSTVYLYVSTQPMVAYDDGQNVQLLQYPAGSATGQPKALTAAATGSTDTEPSWSADGTMIAYDSRASAAGSPGAVHVVSVDGSNDRLVPGTGDYHRPVFAPLAGSGLLAFTQILTDASGQRRGALCVVDVPATGTISTPACTAPDPTYILDRPTWAPDGLSIATIAFDPQTNQPVGVRDFTIGIPGTAGWQPSATLTLQGKHPAFAAWSPALAGGPILAFAAGPAILTAASIAGPGKPLATYPGNVQAALAWRADSVIVVGADCTSGAQAMVEYATASPSPVQLSVPGCNPSVQPLPAPPPPG